MAITCLHICNDFLGSEVHQNLYKALYPSGIKQIVFCPLRQQRIPPKNAAPLNSEVNHIQVIYSSPLLQIHRILFRLKIRVLYKSLVNQIDLSKVDVINASTLYSDGAIAYKIFREFQIPYIISVRATDLNIFYKYRKDLFPLAKQILSNAKEVIFLTPALKRQFMNLDCPKDFLTLIEKKSKIISNGISEFWINNPYPKKEKCSNKLIYVGKLINRKNIIPVVNAVELLTRQGHQISLSIVGDGPLQTKLNRLLSKSKADITYHGKINDRNKLIERYRESCVFIMPAIGETFGLVYLEALTQGLPIIGLKYEGIWNLFEKPVGIFMDNADSATIASAILAVFNEYAKYDCDQIALEEFSWEHISKLYLKIFTKAINPKFITH